MVLGHYGRVCLVPNYGCSSKNIGKFDLFGYHKFICLPHSQAMSRCFPFPPPGYEIKARFDDVSFILKKRKKKRHKDKKERHDRKENRKSESEHREVKYPKKRKHKDEKDKKKDKQRCSEVKKVAVALDNQNGYMQNADSKPCNGIREYRVLDEMGKNCTNGGGVANNQIIRKITLVDQRNANFLGGINEGSNGILAEAYNDIKDKREHSKNANGGGLKGNVRSMRNGLVEKLFGESQIRHDMASCQVDKVKKGRDGKEKSNKGNCWDKEDRQKSEGRDQNSKVKEAEKEKTNESSKEKIKPRASHCDFLEFCGNNSIELLKARHSNEAVYNVVPRKNGHQANNQLKAALASCQISENGTCLHPSRNIVNLAVEKGEVTTNQKVNGKVLTSQAISKNVGNMEPSHSANNMAAKYGRKTEPSQMYNSAVKVDQTVNNHNDAGKFPDSRSLAKNERKIAGLETDNAAEWQLMHNIHNMVIREQTVNCTLERKPATSLRPLSSSDKSEENIGPMKSRHPDSKYLSQILTVPRVEWPQSDDQEWLFGMHSPAKKPKLASTQIDWTKPVWAEAIRLACAGITAMPYIVPY